VELLARVLTGVVAAWIPIEFEVGRGGMKAKLDVRTWSAGVTRMTDAQRRENVRLELSPNTVNKNPG
jgi:hypothetical protein